MDKFRTLALYDKTNNIITGLILLLILLTLLAWPFLGYLVGLNILCIVMALSFGLYGVMNYRIYKPIILFKKINDFYQIFIEYKDKKELEKYHDDTKWISGQQLPGRWLPVFFEVNNEYVYVNFFDLEEKSTLNANITDSLTDMNELSVIYSELAKLSARDLINYAFFIAIFAVGFVLIIIQAGNLMEILNPPVQLPDNVIQGVNNSE